jgi:phospholipid/cholesterol/gamma-HCH transport system substrate-binding protein
MQRNIVETILGAVVLLVAAGFVFFFYRTTDIKPATGYEITASFEKVDGLETGSPVRIGGVRVGQVLGFELDKKNYRAVVHMNIDNGIDLPVDTSAVITSAGLLDGKYMTLQPGNDEEILKPNGKIEYTQTTPSLEQMLGQFVFSMNKNKEGGDSASGNGEDNAPKEAPDEATEEKPENKTEDKPAPEDQP